MLRLRRRWAAGGMRTLRGWLGLRVPRRGKPRARLWRGVGPLRVRGAEATAPCLVDRAPHVLDERARSMVRDLHPLNDKG